MRQEDLVILCKAKIQCKITKSVDLTSSTNEAETSTTDNYSKRHLHVVPIVIIQDRFPKQIPITLLKEYLEWQIVKPEQILNILKLKNKIIMKTLIGLKLIRSLHLRQKRWRCWRRMIRGQLDRSCIKVYQAKAKRLMSIRYFQCQRV